MKEGEPTVIEIMGPSVFFGRYTIDTLIQYFNIPMTLPRQISTLVVGGGPAGIVSLKYTVEYGEAWSEGEEPLLIEMEPEIGGTFRYASILARYFN